LVAGAARDSSRRNSASPLMSRQAYATENAPPVGTADTVMPVLAGHSSVIA
jgi:hypothetical protein